MTTCDDIFYDQMQKVHVVCLTEMHCTMRHQFSSNEINLSNNYHIYRHDRNEHCGGFTMCVNTRLHQKRLHTEQTLTDIKGVQIHTPHTINILCIMYLQDTIDMSVSNLNSLMLTYTDGGMVIVGDFNESILHESKKKHLHSFLTGSELPHHIQVYTTDYGSLLDHIYTRYVTGIQVQVNVKKCYYSDHD